MACTSLVHLALHAVTEAPEDTSQDGQQAKDDHDEGWQHSMFEPALQGHQVGPNTYQRKSYTKQHYTCQGPQLLCHIHHF